MVVALHTKPLREEHNALLPYIDQLHIAADLLGDEPTEATCHHIDALYEFLTYHLIPHAAAEERILYPAVAALLGAGDATATMSRDHVEIVHLTEELAMLRPQPGRTPLDPAQVTGLRRVLYGLYAVVKLHFAKEEEIYLPLLDQRLTESEVNRLFQAMEQVAIETKLELGTGNCPPLD